MATGFLKFVVDGIGDLLGGSEVGIAQQQRNGLEFVQVDRRVALDDAAIRNARRQWWNSLPCRWAVARRVSAHHQRSLRLGIDLAIGAMQRAHQQHAAFEALGIADRGNRHVELRAGPRKWRQRAVIKTAATFFTSTVRGRDQHAHLLHGVGQRLHGEVGLLACRRCGSGRPPARSPPACCRARLRRW